MGEAKNIQRLAYASGGNAFDGSHTHQAKEHHHALVKARIFMAFEKILVLLQKEGG